MCHILRIIADTYSFYDNDHFLMTHAFLRHQMWNLASHLEAATTIQQDSNQLPFFYTFHFRDNAPNFCCTVHARTMEARGESQWR